MKEVSSGHTGSNLAEVTSRRGTGYRLWYRMGDREIGHREFADRMFFEAFRRGSIKARWNRLRWAHFAYLHKPFTAMAWSKWWMI